MPLDNNAIETLSISAVKNSIVMCEYLSQFIAENDKEPSWDGAVYVYGNKNKTKENLKGRMPVQVKGTACDDFSKDDVSYSMSTVDLRNYLYDGGCILFVVYVGNMGLTNKIYYAELTPIKLRQLLASAGEQSSKVVRLKAFPSDNNKKATIFLNCLQNCQKQASFKEGKLLSLEELEKQGLLESVVITFSGVGVDDPQMALSDNEVYLYAKVKGSSIPQPIDAILEKMHTRQTISADITIDGKLFYTEYDIIKSADKVILRYGESFTIRFSSPDQPSEIKYKNSDKIRVLAKDLDFMLSYLDKGTYQIDGVSQSFDREGADLTNFDIEKAKEQLSLAKNVVKLLDLLNCQDDINVNDMEAEDWRNLYRLITAFIDKQPVSGLKNDLPPVCCIKIGNLSFALYIKKCKGMDEGKYELFDFFKNEFDVVLENKKGEKLPISQFYFLHANDFLTLNNIDFDVLLPSFQKVKHHYDTYNRATLFLLELLLAYDKANGKRREKIIEVCNKFSEWICQSPNDEFDYEIKTLNRLQVIKRQRKFTLDEIGVLYGLVENSSTREDSRVGAYLLLDQQQAAEIHFAKLPEEEQNNFRGYPIYHFWKQENIDDGQT
ncbi:MAG: hypothetical protein IKT39_02935 [Clostridia bacterium]|nr:hypothetical protein [Clostridia bacterium]